MDLPIHLNVSLHVVSLFVAPMGCFANKPLAIPSCSNNKKLFSPPAPNLYLPNHLFQFMLGPYLEVDAPHFYLFPLCQIVSDDSHVSVIGSRLHHSLLNRYLPRHQSCLRG